MTKPIRISLVRHGQSKSNLDKKVNAAIADHAVELSPEGVRQADGAGRFLAGYCGSGEIDLRRTAVYVSPYTRTRQTWAGIRAAMVRHHGEETIAVLSVTESLALRELEFGLFDGIADEDLEKTMPVEHRHYAKFVAANGEFFARMPMGESRCDVAQRVHSFFGTLHRDHERHGVDHAIIVTHGVVIRAFVMQWLGHPYEWYAGQRNPDNCSIRSIREGRDHGLIFKGYGAASHSAQERREDGEVGEMTRPDPSNAIRRPEPGRSRPGTTAKPRSTIAER